MGRLLFLAGGYSCSWMVTNDPGVTLPPHRGRVSGTQGQRWWVLLLLGTAGPPTPGWLAWVIMRCKYVGEWYSRRGHFVPVNELMSIFEQIWETRKHIDDLKKYPQCRLHEKKSNLQFRSPAWRYGCVRPWIRNQFPENPTKVRVVSLTTINTHTDTQTHRRRQRQYPKAKTGHG